MSSISSLHQTHALRSWGCSPRAGACLHLSAAAGLGRCHAVPQRGSSLAGAACLQLKPLATKGLSGHRLLGLLAETKRSCKPRPAFFSLCCWRRGRAGGTWKHAGLTGERMGTLSASSGRASSPAWLFRSPYHGKWHFSLP